MPTLLWRRRTSTPHFPGAWPNASTSDHSDDQRLPVYNDDAPPQLPELQHLSSRKDAPNGHSVDDPVTLAEEGWGFSIVSERHGFEDNGRVVGARDRTRFGSQPVSISSPASTSAPLSASLSQASTFSDPTDSEGVLTPESIQGPLWLFPHADTSIAESAKDNLFSSSGSLYHSFDDHVRHRHDSFSHDATIDTINVNTTISSFNTADLHPCRSAARAAYRNPPILDFTEPLPHSRISLDWEAITSSPRVKDVLPQSPTLPQSPIEFSVPSSVASPALGEVLSSEFSTEAMASTFFPVPSTSSHEETSDAQPLLPQPLSSSSAHSLGTDSPVLPVEVDSNHNARPTTNSPYALMAADLDAFAAAAMSTDSSLSLPTSLHSAVSEVMLAASEPSNQSPVWPAHPRACSNDRAGLNPSFAAAACRGNTTEFPTTPGAVEECDEYDEAADAAVEEAIRMRTRRMSAPLLHSPHTPVHRNARRERTQTLGGRVEVQRAEDRTASAGPRAGKLPVLGKMRRLGGRFLSLFGGKGTKPSSSTVNLDVPAELAVKKTRRTAVTKVEFESQHPIPVPETPARDARASRRSLPLRMSKSPSDMAQSPRRDSFLPIEDPESASKGILSIPLQHMRGSPSIQLKRDREPSASNHASPTRSLRARALTAPTKPPPAKTSERAENGKQTRRFSLSSALSKSRLDVLKTTIVPHPPLPDFPQSPTCDQHPHRDEAVRPVRMIPPTGLDAKSSQSSLKGAINGSKKGKERARPVSMFTHPGSSRRPFLDHPQIQVQAPTPVIDTHFPPTADKRTRHASMLVGKEKDARRDMIEVSGSKFRMHHPRKSADQDESAHGDDDPGSNGGSCSAMPPLKPVKETSTEMLQTTTVQDRVLTGGPAEGEILPPTLVEAQLSHVPTRRFSLSSAISQRARSMIASVGRRSSESDRDVDRAGNNSGSTDATATSPPPASTGTSSPRPTHRRGRGSTFSTIIDAGVHFDMLTPGFGFAIQAPTTSPPPRTTSGSPTASKRMSTDVDFPRDRDDASRPDSIDVDSTNVHEVVGMEEYPSPDSDLDSMSFAGTATLMESVASSMVSMDSSYAESFVDAHEQPTESSVSLRTPRELISGLGEPFEGVGPVVKRVELARALSSAIGTSDSSEGGAPILESVEREEERGFLRALGLEVPVEQNSALRAARVASC